MKKLDIKGISNNNNSLHNTYEIKKHESVSNVEGEKKTDKLEISNVARELKVSKTGKDLAAILQKIESKFYDSDEVISATANSILKELKIS